MSKNNNCLFILSEFSWLAWMPKFLKDIQEDISLATHDFKDNKGVKTFLLNTQTKDIIMWVLKNKFRRVVLLTNQSGLKRDLIIGSGLRKKGVNVVTQSKKATYIGSDKIKMKYFLQENNFPTPKFKVVNSIMDAVNFAKRIGYPAILKVANLSEGRMMSLIQSDSDIETYFYEQAISKPVIMEEFILGREVSTIVYHNFGKPLVFPVVYKPKTDYLIKRHSIRTRVYMSPHKEIKPLEKTIQQMALRLSIAIDNESLLGLDIVISNNTIYILEFNSRITETLRMSMILTNVNVLKLMSQGIAIDSNLEPYLKPHGVVIDVPFAQSTSKQIRDKLIKDKSFISASDRRVTLHGTSLKQLINKAAFLKSKLTLSFLRTRAKRSR